MFNFPSYHYEILADVISHKYRSAIIPKYSRKRFENRLFVCDSNISCAGKVSFYNCTFNCDISQNGECITILPRGEAVFKSCTFKRLHSNSGLFLSGNKGCLVSFIDSVMLQTLSLQEWIELEFQVHTLLLSSDCIQQLFDLSPALSFCRQVLVSGTRLLVRNRYGLVPTQKQIFL